MSNIRVREVGEVRAVTREVTEDDLALLRDPDFAGAGVTAEDVHVRAMLLCHDQYDRTWERFRRAHLDRFAQTVVGKSMLPNHDTGGFCGGGSLALGRFFRAGVAQRTEDFPVLVREREPAAKEDGKAPELDADGLKAADLAPGFESRPTRVLYLNPSFYFANHPDNELLRQNIDLGVWRHVSIGFRYDDLDCDLCGKSYLSDCPHYLGRWTEEGKLVTGTYAGDVQRYEALEGSIVYLGAQPNARLIKSMVETGTVDPERLALTPFGQDLVTLKGAEDLARRYGHARKGWSVEKQIPPAPAGADPAAAGERGGTMDLDKLRRLFGLPEDADEAAIEAAARQAQSAQASLANLASGLGGMLKKLDPTAAERAEDLGEQSILLMGLAEVGSKALGDLRDHILADDLRLTGRDNAASELAEILDLQVERRNYDRLKGLYCAKRDEVLKRFPAGLSGDPNSKSEFEETAPAPRARRQDYQLA